MSCRYCLAPSLRCERCCGWLYREEIRSNYPRDTTAAHAHVCSMCGRTYEYDARPRATVNPDQEKLWASEAARKRAAREQRQREVVP